MIAEIARIRRNLEANNVRFSNVEVKVTVHSLHEKDKALDSVFKGLYTCYNDPNYIPALGVDGKIAGVNIKIEVLDRRKKDRQK